MNMTIEQQLDALSEILITLQEAVAHQTREDLKCHGNRDLLIAIQSVKRLMETQRQLLISSEVDIYLDGCLGLHNLN